MKGLRALRTEKFAANRSGTSLGLSFTLATSAHCLLAYSLEERRGDVHREPNNHSSLFTPGVIVIAVTAFDAWLNEFINLGRNSLYSESEIKKLVNMPVEEKYAELVGSPNEEDGKTETTDLALLIKVRNEIVHALPYTQDITSGNTVPDWLGELQESLLIRSRPDFLHFTQKLCSYSLGYWACQTVHAAAKALAESVSGRSVLSDYGAQFAATFAFYESLHAPANLGTYDSQFGLSLP